MNANSMIFLGVLTYMASVLKGVLLMIWGQIFKSYSMSIDVANNEGHGMTNACIKVLKTYKCKAMRNSFRALDNIGSFTALKETDGSNNIPLATGNYTIFASWFTIINAYVQLEEKQNTTTYVYKIYLSIFGWNAKKEYNKFVDAFEEEARLWDYKRRIHTYTSDGWDSNEIKTTRTFDYIFGDEKYTIVSALEQWKKNKDILAKHGIINKIGFLFSGDPGNGKSSVVRAIADYLDMDIIKIDSQEALYSRHPFIKSNAIMLFEDIDCLIETSRKTIDENSGKNMDQLNALNRTMQLLDGVDSGNNMIFILTTNKKEQLEPALIRPGRIHCDLVFSDLSKKAAIEMCESFEVNPEEILADETFPINPAKLEQKILNSFMLVHKTADILPINKQYRHRGDWKSVNEDMIEEKKPHKIHMTKR